MNPAVYLTTCRGDGIASLETVTALLLEPTEDNYFTNFTKTFLMHWNILCNQINIYSNVPAQNCSWSSRIFNQCTNNRYSEIWIKHCTDKPGMSSINRTWNSLYAFIFISEIELFDNHHRGGVSLVSNECYRVVQMRVGGRVVREGNKRQRLTACRMGRGALDGSGETMIIVMNASRFREPICAPREFQPPSWNRCEL